jgi:Questin oxidase-like
MLSTYALDPRLVSRLLGGAVHPLIHLGFACELFAMEPETSKLLLVEALAMQCTTRDQFAAVVDSFKPMSVVNEKEPSLKKDENRVLQLLQQMQHDEALVNIPTKENPDKVDYIISRTDIMSKYYNSFPVSESSPESVQLAFEQLFFAALVIVFGSIRPSTGAEDARLDFFLAHLLTSAVSLRQVLPYVNSTAGAALCRLHYCATLVWYRARGHPSLNMENLLKLPITTRRSPLLTWDACEAKLRENPGMEVHALKVFRALQLVKSEEWAKRALLVQLRSPVGGGGGDGLLPGMTTTNNADDMWLICANVLVQNVARNADFPWLSNDAWDYYTS